MGEWRPLSAEELNRGNRSTEDGVTIHVFLSPYDVPEGVRGDYDEDAKVFRIQFKYLTSEDTREIRREDERISLVVGRNSRRLVGINVDVDALKTKSVELNLMVPKLVDDAIAGLERPGARDSRRANYDLAREVIRTHKEELFAPLAGG